MENGGSLTGRRVLDDNVGYSVEGLNSSSPKPSYVYGKHLRAALSCCHPF